MHVVYERCCGIDIHKKFIVACLCILTTQGTIQKEIRSFSTMTVDLLRLLDWLKALGVLPGKIIIFIAGFVPLCSFKQKTETPNPNKN